jgi:hypothetical protein
MTLRGNSFVEKCRAGVLIAVGLLAATSPARAQRGPAATSPNLSPEILSLACSPGGALEPPPMPLRITGGQDSFVRRIYGPGDLVTINAGSKNGIEVGQEYYVRRLQVANREPISRNTPATIATTGWIRVYAVDDDMSLATISHACDTIEIDDYLEPFKLPVVPTVSKDRPKPQRDHYGKVLVGTDRRTSFGKGDYFVVNRGSDHGIEVGSQFVLYRDKKQAENFLFEIGEGIATEVKSEMSTIQVTVSLDAIESGDYVALRREPNKN